MNLCDCYVVSVLKQPAYVDKYQDVQWWEVYVAYVSESRSGRLKLTFDTEEEAGAVKVGYHFLA